MLFTFSCQSSENENNLLITMGVNGDQLSLIELKGTQWKLAGLYSSETETLKVDNSYNLTLVFFGKEEYEGVEYEAARSGGDFSPSHSLWISENDMMRGGDGLGLILDERYFDTIFWDWWWKINSYSISNSEMKLYTSEDHNYLLYKKIIQ